MHKSEKTLCEIGLGLNRVAFQFNSNYIVLAATLQCLPVEFVLMIKDCLAQVHSLVSVVAGPCDGRRYRIHEGEFHWQTRWYSVVQL